MIFCEEVFLRPKGYASGHAFSGQAKCQREALKKRPFAFFSSTTPPYLGVGDSKSVGKW